MQTSVEQTVDQMTLAWNAGDATAYAQLFTEDATYVTFAAGVSRGRDTIRRDHEPLFSKYLKGSRMRMDVIDIRYLDPDTALVLCRGGVSKRKTVPLNKVQSFVLRRHPDQGWLCAAFHNTKKNPLMIWLASRGSK